MRDETARAAIEHKANRAATVMGEVRQQEEARAYYEHLHDVAQSVWATSGVTDDGRLGGRGDLNHPGYRYDRLDGEKFDGGLGPIELLLVDYWSLRRRSITFFKKNLYARGIIRRLVTNIINTGLGLEASPVSDLLPMSEDQAVQWGMRVDDLFQSWGDLADVCDWTKQNTFGELQRTIYREALITGDILILEHHNAATQMPVYELIDGGLVQTPHQTQSVQAQQKGNRIMHGVEVNKRGEHVAYYIIQEDFKFKRVPARGANNRRLAWLHYGTDKRHGETRGEPLLTTCMQSVSEIDTYRDSTQRKATVGSLLAMYLYHSTDSKVMNSKPITAGGAATVEDSKLRGDGTIEQFKATQMPPGFVIEQLPPGLEPKAFSNDGTDEKFGEFEQAILHGISWHYEIPLSVLTMRFGNSYSASRGEIKEFNQFVMKERDRLQDNLLRPIYRSWLRAAVLTDRVSAPGMLESARNPRRFDEWAAWTNSDWYGAVKEAVDLPKEVAGQKAMAEEGYTTNRAASRAMTGTSFNKNIARVARENQRKADAMRPLLELQRDFGAEAVAGTANMLAAAMSNSNYEEA